MVEVSIWILLVRQLKAVSGVRSGELRPVVFSGSGRVQVPDPDMPLHLTFVYLTLLHLMFTVYDRLHVLVYFI
jgi:hypothetical protein